MSKLQYVFTTLALATICALTGVDFLFPELHLAEYAIGLPPLAALLVGFVGTSIVAAVSVIVALLHASSSMEESQGFIHVAVSVLFAWAAVVTTQVRMSRYSALENLAKTTQNFERARRDSNFDSLTELSNRRGVLEEIESLPEDSWPRVLMVFDLDGLKRVNDQFGHSAGDDLLRIFAFRVSRGIQRKDIFGRWGGDEFVGVFQVDLKTGEQIAERLLTKVTDQPIRFSDAEQAVGVSIGLVSWTPDMSFDSAFTLADDAMYASKRSGGSRVTVGDRR